MTIKRCLHVVRIEDIRQNDVLWSWKFQFPTEMSFWHCFVFFIFFIFNVCRCHRYTYVAHLTTWTYISNWAQPNQNVFYIILFFFFFSDFGFCSRYSKMGLRLIPNIVFRSFRFSSFHFLFLLIFFLLLLLLVLMLLCLCHLPLSLVLLLDIHWVDCFAFDIHLNIIHTDQVYLCKACIPCARQST